MKGEGWRESFDIWAFRRIFSLPCLSSTYVISSWCGWVENTLLKVSWALPTRPKEMSQLLDFWNCNSSSSDMSFLVEIKFSAKNLGYLWIQPCQASEYSKLWKGTVLLCWPFLCWPWGPKFGTLCHMGKCWKFWLLLCTINLVRIQGLRKDDLILICSKSDLKFKI